ncbi:MAG: hypothetical protein GTN49_11495 [candidate division Zixibacteria bacterium]|nr:hypothetical protein [candidate division Zixibacteria bacterium]
MIKNLICVATLSASTSPTLPAWSPPEHISPAEGNWRTCYNFATALVADDEKNLHAVFFEEGGASAYWRRYNRFGRRWEAPYRLDESGGRDAAITVDATDQLHVFFKAGNALCHRGGDGMGNWGPREYLAVSGWHLGHPSPLPLPDGDVALAMVGERTSGGPAYIWFTVWRHDGRGFEPPARVSDTKGHYGSWMPTMAYFQKKIRVVWRDDSSGECELYERTREGSSWTPTRRLTYDPAKTFHPRLAAEGGVLRLFFMDRRLGRPAIWEMVDAGGGWGPEHVLYDGGGIAYHPNVASAPDGRLLLFWEDNRETPAEEVFYGTLFGKAWSAAARVSQSPRTHSACPSAAVTNDGEIAVIYTEGQKDVCVQRLPLSEAPAGGVNFRARATPAGVKLSWDGENVDRFGRFNLYRARLPGEDWWRLNADAIVGRPPFTYYDEPRSPGHYAYKLEGQTGTGQAMTCGAVRVTVGEGRPFIAGLSVSPNPCRESCSLAWRQEGPAAATVAAYDIAGRRVAASGIEAAAGANTFELDASRLAPGCYVAAVNAGGEESHTSFVVTR